MRRTIAIIGLVLVLSGFTTLALSIAFNITFIIPVALIFGAFVMLSIAKRMDPGAPRETNDHNGKYTDIDGNFEEYSNAEAENDKQE